jgi:hypothetical protein
MPQKKKRPAQKSVPHTSEMARSQNAPSKQQRDDNERETFISQAAERTVRETTKN